MDYHFEKLSDPLTVTTSSEGDEESEIKNEQDKTKAADGLLANKVIDAEKIFESRTVHEAHVKLKGRSPLMKKCLKKIELK